MDCSTSPKASWIPPTDAAEHLIVALDFPSLRTALDLVDRLDGRCRWFKVGLELYLAAGTPVIEALRKRDLQVFLDLKLHDIPNTVASAVEILCSSGASLLTLHASGGSAMLSAAVEIVKQFRHAPKLLAVTLLTSMDQERMEEVGLSDDPAAQVLRLARIAQAAGISGMICSPRETSMLRTELGDDLLLVTPGIRPTSATPGDQRRFTTPAEAIAAGASMLVVGRPITRSPDPGAAASAILAEMTEAAYLRKTVNRQA